jgi:hypothetical protein
MTGPQRRREHLQVVGELVREAAPLPVELPPQECAHQERYGESEECCDRSLGHERQEPEEKGRHRERPQHDHPRRHRDLCDSQILFESSPPARSRAGAHRLGEQPRRQDGRLRLLVLLAFGSHRDERCHARDQWLTARAEDGDRAAGQERRDPERYQHHRRG